MHFAAYKMPLHHVSSLRDTREMANTSSLMRLSKLKVMSARKDMQPLVTVSHLGSFGFWKRYFFANGAENILAVPKLMNHRQVLSICNFHVDLMIRCPFIFNSVKD